MSSLHNTATGTGPLTEVAAWHIRDGGQRELEDWRDETAAAARDVPGLIGVDIMPPGDVAGEYVVVFRFDTYEHLRTWHESDIRRQALRRAEVFRESRVSGETKGNLEFCFEPVGSPTSPPRWKMTLVTTAAVWPASMFIPWLLRPLISTLPPYLRALLVAIGIVNLLTWVLLPVLSKILRSWLLGPASSAPHRT
jgi:uncharacterized protein